MKRKIIMRKKIKKVWEFLTSPLRIIDKKIGDFVKENGIPVFNQGPM